jgi:hypothetical protein
MGGPLVGNIEVGSVPISVIHELVGEEVRHGILLGTQGYMICNEGGKA